jgi:hypothetical protein
MPMPLRFQQPQDGLSRHEREFNGFLARWSLKEVNDGPDGTKSTSRSQCHTDILEFDGLLKYVPPQQFWYQAPNGQTVQAAHQLAGDGLTGLREAAPLEGAGSSEQKRVTHANDESKKNNTRCRLLELPQKVRVRIWAFVVSYSEPIPIRLLKTVSFINPHGDDRSGSSKGPPGDSKDKGSGGDTRGVVSLSSLLTSFNGLAKSANREAERSTPGPTTIIKQAWFFQPALLAALPSGRIDKEATQVYYSCNIFLAEPTDGTADTLLTWLGNVDHLAQVAELRIRLNPVSCLDIQALRQLHINGTTKKTTEELAQAIIKAGISTDRVKLIPVSLTKHLLKDALRLSENVNDVEVLLQGWLDALQAALNRLEYGVEGLSGPDVEKVISAMEGAKV